jgi:tol-pal system protein YbgF
MTRVEQLEGYLHSAQTAPKEREAPAAKAPPQRDVAQTETGVYERTLAHYREARYEEAIAGFKGFLESYPKSDLADNAQFWIGECYRALKNYEEAILAYQKVVNGYPKGNKVPAAMLQQAFAFEKLNDTTTANLVFRKLIKEYPTAREADIAKKRLGQK